MTEPGTELLFLRSTKGSAQPDGPPSNFVYRLSRSSMPIAGRQACYVSFSLPINRVYRSRSYACCSVCCMPWDFRPLLRFVCSSVSPPFPLPLRGTSNPKPLQLGEFLGCTLSRNVQNVSWAIEQETRGFWETNLGSLKEGMNERTNKNQDCMIVGGPNNRGRAPHPSWR